MGGILIPLESIVLTILALLSFSSIWSGFINAGYGFANNIVIYNITFDLVIIIVQYLILKFNYEDKIIEEVGLKLSKNSVKNSLQGIFIGFLVITFTYFTIFAVGIVSYEGLGFNYFKVAKVFNFLGSHFIRMIFVALAEEILFRGVILNKLLKNYNKYLCVVISAVIFSAFHCIRYDSITQLTSILVMGIFLAYLYIKTKSLYAPIGMHFAVDFFYNVLAIKGEIGLLIFKLNNGYTENDLTLIIFGLMSIIAAIILILLVIFKKNKNCYVGKN